MTPPPYKLFFYDHLSSYIRRILSLFFRKLVTSLNQYKKQGALIIWSSNNKITLKKESVNNDTNSILFQSFLEANSKCWWNAALVDATRQLRYKGHVSPGVLMVGGPPCALEVLRAAWARNVLRPPADHAITCLGECSIHSEQLLPRRLHCTPFIKNPIILEHF